MPRLSDVAMEMLPEVQNVPEPILVNALRSSARNFCYRSQVWRLGIEDKIKANNDTLVLDIPVDSEIVEVKDIKDMDSNRTIQTTWTVEEPEDGVIKLKHKIDVDTPIIADTILTVSAMATRIDDSAFSRWIDAVKHGALYIVMSMRGREWLDPQIALWHKGEFDMGIEEAKIFSVNKNLDFIKRNNGTYVL